MNKTKKINLNMIKINFNILIYMPINSSMTQIQNKLFENIATPSF